MDIRQVTKCFLTKVKAILVGCLNLGVEITNFALTWGIPRGYSDPLEIPHFFTSLKITAK